LPESVDDPVLDDDAFQSGSAAIALERDSAGVTILVVGELDLEASPHLTRVLDRLSSDEPGRLLLDLNAVEFMDSTGLAALVHAQETADRHGYRLAVRYRPETQVHRLLQITGMVDHFRSE
jgi:anti-sigma B factor antagonist